MRKFWLPWAAAVLVAGCGHAGGSGSVDAVEQQRRDVMGGPAPASVQADIAAKQAAAQQKIQAHAAGQKPGP